MYLVFYIKHKLKFLSLSTRQPVSSRTRGLISPIIYFLFVKRGLGLVGEMTGVGYIGW